MKEKKIVASVVLGITLVSLITALVVALFDSFVLFIDSGFLYSQYHSYSETVLSQYKNYCYIIGAFMLLAVMLGVAFLGIFFTNKEKCVKRNGIVAGVFVGYCFVTIIISRVLLLEYHYVFEQFTSYLAAAITLGVSAALVFASWYYLTLIKKKEEQSQNIEQEPAHTSADDE